MGNSESHNATPKSPATTPTPGPTSLSQGRRDGGVGASSSGGSTRHSPQLSHATRKAVHSRTPPLSNPTATLVSTSGTASTSVTHENAQASSPKRNHQHFASGHSRPRSITAGGVLPPQLASQELSHSQKSDSTTDTMGQSDSKPMRPVSRASTLPIQHATPPKKSVTLQEPGLKEESHDLTRTSTNPVDVPPPSNNDGQAEREPAVPVTGYSESPYSLPPPNFVRPPRLPLPIEEEHYAPGSPLLTPQDAKDAPPLEFNDIEAGPIPRKSSVLSSTTLDEDEEYAESEFTEGNQWGQVRVPTKLEWNGAGEKIFVTGTFCNWERKVKLHKNKDKPGFSASVPLQPGTHHVKFLVDGEMVTSDELPTTVDWTNILVNYVEIVAPLPPEAETQPPAPAEPMAIPGAAITAGQATGTSEPAARPLTDRTEARAPETEADLPSTMQEAVGPKGERLDGGQTEAATAPKPPQKQEAKPTPAPPKQKQPRPKYTNKIPQFLIDHDQYQITQDDQYKRGQHVADSLPQPPSLPMFLSKSILNGATPHKDDASVLIMPNHTVLNHLATSSIKNGVLATSGTTRYKRKFLTTIMYKPTSDDG